MNKININIPDKTLSILPVTQAFLFNQGKKLKSLKKILPVSKIAKLTKVDQALIWGIILVPTGGVELPITNKNGGICDLNYEVVRKALITEVKNGRISEQENDWLGQNSGVKGNILNPVLDLSNRDLNVFLASIYLGQLLDFFKSNEALKMYYLTQHNAEKAKNCYRDLMAKGGMLEMILDA